MKAREAEFEREIERWWRQPTHRRAVAWGVGGFAIGALFVLVLLLLFAPAPQAVKSSPPVGSPAISVTMNDTFLTQLVRTGIAEAHLPIALTNIQAHIEPNNRIAISADTVGLPSILPSQLNASGQLYVANGKALINITHAGIGGLSLPGALTTALQTALNAQLVPLETNLVPTSTPYQITSISTHSGLLTMNLSPA